MLVLNLVPDPAAAPQEMMRVTCPGGMVAAGVWDYREAMQMLRTFWDAAVALDLDAAPRRATKATCRCLRAGHSQSYRARTDYGASTSNC